MSFTKTQRKQCFHFSGSDFETGKSSNFVQVQFFHSSSKMGLVLSFRVQMTAKRMDTLGTCAEARCPSLHCRLGTSSQTGQLLALCKVPAVMYHALLQLMWRNLTGTHRVWQPQLEGSLNCCAEIRYLWWDLSIQALQEAT